MRISPPSSPPFRRNSTHQTHRSHEKRAAGGWRGSGLSFPLRREQITYSQKRRPEPCGRQSTTPIDRSRQQTLSKRCRGPLDGWGGADVALSEPGRPAAWLAGLSSGRCARANPYSPWSFGTGRQLTYVWTGRSGMIQCGDLPSALNWWAFGTRTPVVGFVGAMIERSGSSSGVKQSVWQPARTMH